MTVQAMAPSHPSVVPGPPGWPLLGNIAEMRRGPFHEVLLSLHETYGDIFRLRFPAEPALLVVRSPEALKRVLQTNARNYIKGQQLEVARPLIGDGLFISEGERWLRQRRLMQPAFVRPAVRRMGARMAQTIADDVVRRWETAARDGRPLAVKAEMMRLALQVVARTMFSGTLTDEDLRVVDEHFSFLLRVVTERSHNVWYNLFPWLQRAPTPTNRRFQQALAALEELVYRLIADRRRTGDYGDDVAGMLLRARDEASGQGMTDKQLRDELITLFLAGHETTAIALTWALAVLSRYPALRRRLQAEVDEVLGDRLPTGEDFDRLPFTRAFFDEVLRVYPPQVVMLRQAVGPDELDGFPVRAGQNLLLNIHGVHYHPGYWDNPQGFDPDRFAPFGPGPQHKFAYIPFGAGPRQCLGNHFALMEGVLALAIIHQRYVLDLLPDTRLEPDAVGTLRPKGPVLMRVRFREEAHAV